MTLKEQLLQEIEIAPENLLKELLTLCRGRYESGDRPAADLPFGTISPPLEAVKRLQAKLKLANPEGQSLVDELIAERRSEAANE
jgi:hypothetical protein